MLHLFPPKKENNYLTFHEQIHNRVFRISKFRENMCPCKKPFRNHILIIFTLKKDFSSHLQSLLKKQELFL